MTQALLDDLTILTLGPQWRGGANNRKGTAGIINALRAGVRKVVHTSSSAVYGAPEKNPVDELTPPCPGEDYGRAKLAAEGIQPRVEVPGDLLTDDHHVRTQLHLLLGEEAA